MSFVNIVQALLAIWLLTVTIGLVYIFPYFRLFRKSSKTGEITEIINNLLSQKEKESNILSELRDDLKRVDNEGKKHVQKIGFLRFNPFEETGGDHSFSLALLDGRESGVVLTCLHARERTRIYVKPILRGKSELTLSVEEKKAIEKALKS